MADSDKALVDLLRQVVVRAEDLVAAEERVRTLLDAVVAVGGDLDLHATLERIVVSAASLVNARYAALGVLGGDSGAELSDFITHGLTDEQRARIGPLPRGHGILGLLITDPRPLRLHDLREHPASYGFPAEHPQMDSFLGVPVRVRDRVFGNLYLTDKNGSGDFTGEDEAAVVALAATAGIAIENARLFEQTERRERWVGATAEIQQALLRRTELTDALKLVTTRAREVGGADLALIVLEQDDSSLRVEQLDGDREDLRHTILPRVGALEDVVEHGATVRLSEGVALAGLDGLRSALLVPFTGPGGASGALLVAICAARNGAWPSDDEVQAIRGFAAQVTLALDRAQAQQDRLTLAVLSDRDRIARDLHDLVIQQLFATGLSLQGLTKRLAQRPDDADRVRAAVEQLDETVRTIRTTIFELDSGETDTDLRAQIHRAAAAAGAALGQIPRVELTGPLDSAVPDGVRPHLLAVIVEALSNVARHADASSVEVRVAVADGQVIAHITDDGCGFGSTRGGRGLANMRGRAQLVGGTSTVDSLSGRGTTVRWTAPLRPQVDPKPAAGEDASLSTAEGRGEAGG